MSHRCLWFGAHSASETAPDRRPSPASTSVRRDPSSCLNVHRYCCIGLFKTLGVPTCDRYAGCFLPALLRAKEGADLFEERLLFNGSFMFKEKQHSHIWITKTPNFICEEPSF
ncbi:unnamed protein product [Victoria cruziana]